MSTQKRLHRTYTPPAEKGFLGPGHVARPVIQVSFSESDPFIMLMDDYLDKRDDNPAGGPHPHAGFETVTLMLQGEIGEAPHKMRAGDFEMMTAGSGVVHTETITERTKMRLLQLWLNLPKEKRWTEPRIQRLPAENVPSARRDGVTARVYSGNFFGLTSPVLNHTPVIIAEVRISKGQSLREAIPGHYAAFIYVLSGGVTATSGGPVIGGNQVAWFERSDDERSDLALHAEDDTHFVLYAAEPQHHEIVSYGPFIGDSMDDIRRLYTDYQLGKIGHINDVPVSQHLIHAPAEPKEAS